jgi:hypothetical protein
VRYRAAVLRWSGARGTIVAAERCISEFRKICFLGDENASRCRSNSRGDVGRRICDRAIDQTFERKAGDQLHDNGIRDLGTRRRKDIEFNGRRKKRGAARRRRRKLCRTDSAKWRQAYDRPFGLPAGFQTKGMRASTFREALLLSPTADAGMTPVYRLYGEVRPISHTARSWTICISAPSRVLR